MPGNNSAQRVFDHISRVNSIAGNIKTVEGYAQLFGLGGAKDQLDASRSVSQHMLLLLQQVDEVERACVARRIPVGLYSRQVSQVRNALNLSALSTNFENARSQIQPDVLLAFEWAAYDLPADEGVPIDPDELKTLIERLNQARHDPMLDLLPPELRAFAITHLDALIGAFTNYSLTGAAPLQRAIKDLATDAATFDAEAAAEIKSASKEAQSFWQKTTAVLKKSVDVASATGKAAEGIEKLIKLAEKTGLLEWMKSP